MGVAGVDHDCQGFGHRNEDGRCGFSIPKDASVGSVSRVEVGSAGAEAAEIRAFPASSTPISLGVVAGHHQRSTDSIQLSHTFGLGPTSKVNETQLLLVAKEFGITAKAVHSNWPQMPNNTLPVNAGLSGRSAIARLPTDGHPCPAPRRHHEYEGRAGPEPRGF
jgi:hypothetical protein